ncbi:hypothetical protein NW759_006918 [Fusarium solani]|nr:hypothetical protein NW759_006918 [Fusarium solani]
MSKYAGEMGSHENKVSVLPAATSDGSRSMCSKAQSVPHVSVASPEASATVGRGLGNEDMI